VGFSHDIVTSFYILAGSK